VKSPLISPLDRINREDHPNRLIVAVDSFGNERRSIWRSSLISMILKNGNNTLMAGIYSRAALPVNKVRTVKMFMNSTFE
jgi:hypothetical protein